MKKDKNPRMPRKCIKEEHKNIEELRKYNYWKRRPDQEVLKEELWL